ncbi:MAG: ankyrin repeat domain-containing protein [Rubrivivax sp.]|nr:ankyrin repeat domain-containing protein [Rubrivivax sp.]
MNDNLKKMFDALAAGRNEEELMCEVAELSDHATLLALLDAGWKITPSVLISAVRPQPLANAEPEDIRKTVELLLDRGARVNDRNKSGYDALWSACSDGDHFCVEILLAHGADVNQVYKNGVTPLHGAAHSGSAECVSLLLKKGADPGESLEIEFLLEVAKDGALDVLKAWKERTEIEAEMGPEPERWDTRKPPTDRKRGIL